MSSQQKRLAALVWIVASLALIAAADLPDHYWQHPAATATLSGDAADKLLPNLAPQACAQCHVRQFSGWQQSLHARTFSPGLLGQLPHRGVAVGNSCLVCHAPLSEQAFADKTQLADAVAMSRLHQQQGLDAADDHARQLPLRHSGVSCAACHVRNGQWFGPPQRNTGKTGKIKGLAHDGFTGLTAFEQSQFCAACHQFPAALAIHGKPLQNTFNEWQQSSFARAGIHCQSCHMPDRKHVFKGIHDSKTVRDGLTIAPTLSLDAATLTITSINIGHAFPSYAVPKVVVSIVALDDQGQVLKQQQWEIARHVLDDNGWQELSDTRLMPGETRNFTLAALPAPTKRLRFTVDVYPDFFYKGVYAAMLAQGMAGDAGALIEQAQAKAQANDYRLYAHELKR